MQRPTIESADPARRRAFLDARREASRTRFDTRFAADYDEHWGEIPPSHQRHISLLLGLLPAGPAILDAACGTGRFWPLLLERAGTLVGVDQSQAMLDAASAKHPDVPTERVALQDLGFLRAFDAIVCVDAMENVGPEDWPLVLERLTAAGKAHAYLYLTSELPEDDDPHLAVDADDLGEPIVEGESFDGVGYHYFPDRTHVMRWLDEAGLDLLHEAEADGYRHLLLRRR
jgi:cyclopropane fatty-acyl-phospholipid synthase-like methyltransferase